MLLDWRYTAFIFEASIYFRPLKIAGQAVYRLLFFSAHRNQTRNSWSCFRTVRSKEYILVSAWCAEVSDWLGCTVRSKEYMQVNAWCAEVSDLLGCHWTFHANWSLAKEAVPAQNSMCLHVCVHVHGVHACMCACVCMCTHMCVHVQAPKECHGVHTHMHAHTHTCTHAHAHAHTHTHTLHKCMHTCAHTQQIHNEHYIWGYHQREQ